MYLLESVLGSDVLQEIHSGSGSAAKVTFQFTKKITNPIDVNSRLQVFMFEADPNGWFTITSLATSNAVQCPNFDGSTSSDGSNSRLGQWKCLRNPDGTYVLVNRMFSQVLMRIPVAGGDVLLECGPLTDSPVCL